MRHSKSSGLKEREGGVRNRRVQRSGRPAFYNVVFKEREEVVVGKDAGGRHSKLLGSKEREGGARNRRVQRGGSAAFYIVVRSGRKLSWAKMREAAFEVVEFKEAGGGV